MNENECFPRISTGFDEAADFVVATSYRAIICGTLKKILPEVFTSECVNEMEIARRFELFHAQLPIFTYTPFGDPPYNISFYLLNEYRVNSYKFYFELISSWLVPGQRLDVVLFNAVDFFVRDFGDRPYTLSEVLIHVESDEQDVELRKNLPFIGKEIKLGVVSSYYARRILETKGLAADEKIAMIQEQMTYLIKKLPHYFDRDLFSEMQHLMVICSDEFKRKRNCRHLARIISTFYLFRKKLAKSVKDFSDRRHTLMKIFYVSGSDKKVLGIIVGVNFFNSNEVLENRHIVKAIKNYISDVDEVEGSFFICRRLNENYTTIYLEIENTNGAAFEPEEIQRLKDNLSDDLKDRIEHLVHPLFMPRNDEEIFRNIVSLSDQIKTTKDQPQMFISFDEQNHEHLYFLVILVRVIRDGEEEMVDLFVKANSFLEYIHESKKHLGYLRKKYPKEASVFKVKFPKYPFLRDDHSIDLFKARQVISNEIERVLQRKVRDYNGGMISKQHELFCRLRELLDEEGGYNDLMLEKYFYSLKPAVMRNVLEAEELKDFFQMMQRAFEHRKPSERTSFEVHRHLTQVMVMITTDDSGLPELLEREIQSLNIASPKLVHVCVNSYDIFCLGFLYKCEDPYSQDHFCRLLENLISAGVCS